MQTNNPYKDLFGREIKIGDYITYAANDGRCGVLRVGRVVELTESKEINYCYNVESKIPKIRAKSARYRMIDYKTREYGWNRQKDVSLGFLDRLIVVDNLPAEVQAVLEN